MEEDNELYPNEKSNYLSKERQYDSVSCIVYWGLDSLKELYQVDPKTGKRVIGGLMALGSIGFGVGSIYLIGSTF